MIDVKKVARLARISVRDDEAEAFGKQLRKAIDYFESLASINTDNVEPLVTPININTKLRKDQSEKWKEIETVLEDAPDTVGNLFRVPPVI